MSSMSSKLSATAKTFSFNPTASSWTPSTTAAAFVPRVTAANFTPSPGQPNQPNQPTESKEPAPKAQVVAEPAAAPTPTPAPTPKPAPTPAPAKTATKAQANVKAAAPVPVPNTTAAPAPAAAPAAPAAPLKGAWGSGNTAAIKAAPPAAPVPVAKVVKVVKKEEKKGKGKDEKKGKKEEKGREKKGREGGREGGRDANRDAKKSEPRSEKPAAAGGNGGREKSPRPAPAARPAENNLAPTPVSESGTLPKTAGWGVKKAVEEPKARAPPVVVKEVVKEVAKEVVKEVVKEVAKVQEVKKTAAIAAKAPVVNTAKPVTSPATTPTNTPTAAQAAAAPAWGAKSNISAVKEVGGVASTAGPAPVGPKWGDEAMKREKEKGKEGGKWGRGEMQQAGGKVEEDNKWGIRGQAVPDRVDSARGTSIAGNDAGGWSRGKALPVELYKGTSGQSAEESGGVLRYGAGELMSLRLESLSCPLMWESEDSRVPAHIRWSDPERVSLIAKIVGAARIGGDVSRMKGNPRTVDTAPRLEDCKPLEVNDETRWKAGVLGGEEIEGDEAVLKKALIVLNKLTLTTFEKLSNEFIDSGITNSVELLKIGIDTIVTKAQQETHFSEMYAQLCLKFASRALPDLGDDPAKGGKKFKKMLITRVQEEFEKDLEGELKTKCEGMDDAEVKYWEGLAKKYYLGHIVFIGELYKTELMSFRVMMGLIPTLLGNDEALSTTSEHMLTSKSVVDDEKIECLLKLLTNVGYYLSEQAKALREVGKGDEYENKMNACFRNINGLAKGSAGMPVVNSRCKFMCKDLIEMRDNGWQVRREEEKAKTIDQIHKDIEREEKRGGRGGGNSSSSSSSSAPRSSSIRSGQGDARKAKAGAVDGDGWATVAPVKGGGGGRASSQRSPSGGQKSEGSGPQASGFAALSQKSDGGGSAKAPSMSADEAGKAVVSSFKEFLTGGDAEELSRTVLECVGGSKEHGAAVFRDAVLMLLEMKVEDAMQFESVLFSAPFTPAMIKNGFVDPVEFWADVAIDAPLAKTIMASFLNAGVKNGFVSKELIEAMEGGAEAVKLMV